MDCYKRLRPKTEIESCECKQVTGLLIVYLFTNNPICCIECRKEVDPERLRLTCEIVDKISSCFMVYRAIYELWLDSGEYEDWAKQKLIDPHSQVNQNGMAVAKELSQQLPSYYWWFYDTGESEPTACPNCSSPLDTKVKFGAGKCDQCCIAI